MEWPIRRRRLQSAPPDGLCFLRAGMSRDSVGVSKRLAHFRCRYMATRDDKCPRIDSRREDGS
jgi:hypothetical protein